MQHILRLSLLRALLESRPSPPQSQLQRLRSTISYDLLHILSVLPNDSSSRLELVVKGNLNVKSAGELVLRLEIAWRAHHSLKEI